MTKKGLTAIAVVLDKSGSMKTIREETISSFNQFLREQQAAPGEALFSLTLFDTNLDIRHVARPINEVNELTTATYVPDGYTALYDAVATTIDALGAKLTGLPEDQRPERVLFVIQTDGQENMSQRFNAEQVKQRIDHQRDKYNWDFIFLGAGQDAWLGAGRIGIELNKTLSYDPADQVQTMSIASAYTTAFRSTGDAKLDTNDLRKKTTK